MPEILIKVGGCLGIAQGGILRTCWWRQSNENYLFLLSVFSFPCALQSLWFRHPYNLKSARLMSFQLTHMRTHACMHTHTHTHTSFHV